MSTTPLERDILTHYYTTPGPYLGGSEYWQPVHAEAVRRFISRRLLVSEMGSDGLMHVVPNMAALKVYMNALGDVPLPVQEWVLP